MQDWLLVRTTVFSDLFEELQLKISVCCKLEPVGENLFNPVNAQQYAF